MGVRFTTATPPSTAGGCSTARPGPQDAPAFVLLHGFPTSSFMFRDLIPRLADRYHVIAPDHLGFGLSDAPSGGGVRLHLRRADRPHRRPARSARA